MSNPKGNPTGNPYGTRWRGKLPIPQRAHPLVRELFAEMNRQMVTMRELGQRAGMRYQGLSAWRYNRNPYLPNFIAAANSLGLELRLVRKRDEAANAPNDQI